MRSEGNRTPLPSRTRSNEYRFAMRRNIAHLEVR